MFNIITPVVQQVSGIEDFYPVYANRSIWDAQNTSTVQQENEAPQVKEKNNTEKTPSASSAIDAVKPQRKARSENNHYQDILQILFFIWLTGFILLICFTTYENIKFKKKISSITLCTNQRLNGILDKCIEQVGLKRRIPIFHTIQTRTPSLYGVIKPKILISSGFAENFNDDELRYILCHELSHYKRKDILTNWILTILQLIHWFNPIIWYSFYIMRQDCEIACDAQVLSCLEESERIKYGQTIINLLKVFTESYFIPSTAGLIKSKSGLKRRITMISLFKKKSWVSALGAIALIVVVAIVGLPSPKLLASSDEVIHFKDSNIQAAVEKSLEKPSGSTILKSDMQKVKGLNIQMVSYADDIKYCTNLESLLLHTPIDFKLLGNIKSLKSITLNYDISDLKDINYCKNLEELDVVSYTAGNTSTFSNLTGLKKLSIGFKVSNTDLSGLKSLKRLNEITFFSLKGKNNLNELSNLKQLKTLRLILCSDLENIDSLSSVSNLSIIDQTKLTNESIQVLKKFKNLRNLWIEEITIKDLKFLEKLTDLESLIMMNTQIKDISPLKNLTKLTHLNLAGNRISDIGVLANMKKLKYIELEVNRIKNIEPLSDLKDVETLYLNINQISNISALSGLTNLKILNLEKNKIVDISPLRSLVNVDNLNLSQNSIKDINALASMKKLNTLYLRDNQITDIAILGKLAELNEIDLSNNKIVDISPLRSLVNVDTLHLSQNYIKDINTLASMKKLNTLFLRDNQISDIAILGTLVQLNGIDLSNNKITNVKPLAGLTKLLKGHLMLKGNSIKDYSPISAFYNPEDERD